MNTLPAQPSAPVVTEEAWELLDQLLSILKNGDRSDIVPSFYPVMKSAMDRDEAVRIIGPWKDLLIPVIESALASQAGAPQGVPPVPSGLHTNTDARAWADYFMVCTKAKPSIATDRDCMVGWFANAMMAMHDGSQAGAGDGGWIECAAKLPQRDSHDYYQDRYSIAVSINTKHKSLFRWDYRMRGWVDARWSDGCNPCDYSDWDIMPTHWRELPEGPRA